MSSLAAARRLHLDLGPRSYDIVVGGGLIREAGQLIAPHLKRPRAIIVVDAAVAGLYLEPLAQSLRAASVVVDHVVVPSGEESKSFAELQRLCETLLQRGIDRSSALIALGGGVVGDLAGFAASILLRGIDFIQVPTTLLAQVDSSVGGKTAIDCVAGKNLVGSFHQPRLVVADTKTLDSLPPRELRGGYAEVVKYGLIRDRAFFDWLDVHGMQVLKGDGDKRSEAIFASCRHKAAVVAADEKETGERALLNFGHTFAHALEAETGFGATLLHGEAVAIGMVMAFDFSVRLGLCPATEASLARRHLARLGLPVDLSGLRRQGWDRDALLMRMARDKKALAGKFAFVLTQGIGKAFFTADIPRQEIAAFLDSVLLDAPVSVG